MRVSIDPGSCNPAWLVNARGWISASLNGEPLGRCTMADEGAGILTVRRKSHKSPRSGEETLKGQVRLHLSQNAPAEVRRLWDRLRQHKAGEDS